jgi:hypothetical protein
MGHVLLLCVAIWEAHQGIMEYAHEPRLIDEQFLVIVWMTSVGVGFFFYLTGRSFTTGAPEPTTLWFLCFCK